ncbi:hypothetical protein GNI_005250 [Gregarina niphandrodes]|uniref:Uncharacterized protein n=1 Tax=Gregarina niphandrodes TaxID=110365 RepID=A0A023BDG5_GRENI|nr:hypothetical protein GNI_005250 [Gregarina niphandrodes]EZG88177.1 hypothetical protein GNI_005250 [Gregarina niphandrodes]|eukprot:XP_011128601.1 hypothetical protein GNI_005250 [Gregarina niphandrodes]
MEEVGGPSQWRRGEPKISWNYGPLAIQQSANWSSKDTLRSTKLLLKSLVFQLGTSLLMKVAVRPDTSEGAEAGLVFGYVDPSNYYYTYLSLGADSDDAANQCGLEFGRVQDGTESSIAYMQCKVGSGGLGGGYHLLAVQSDPLSFKFFVDQDAVGQTVLGVGDYRTGSVGLLSKSKPVSFQEFVVGGTAEESQALWEDTSRPRRTFSVVQEYNDLESKFDSADSRETSAPPGSNNTETKNDDLVCLMPDYWRWINKEDQTELQSMRDLRTSDVPEYCLVKYWSCQDSEISIRMTFHSDGEGGLVFRAHNETLRTHLMIETMSQKVTLYQLVPETGLQPLYQTISTIPLLAHETNTVRVRDVGGRISVFINEERLIDAVIPNKAEALLKSRIAYGAGFILARGSASFSGLKFAPL